MATNDALRANFIKKTVEFLKKHHLDGLGKCTTFFHILKFYATPFIRRHFSHSWQTDIDWEYPANRDTADHPEDKFYFTLLCKVGY